MHGLSLNSPPHYRLHTQVKQVLLPFRYRERLVLEKALVLKALEPGTVSLEHVTSKPYEVSIH